MTGSAWISTSIWTISITLTPKYVPEVMMHCDLFVNSGRLRFDAVWCMEYDEFLCGDAVEISF